MRNADVKKSKQQVINEEKRKRLQLSQKIILKLVLQKKGLSPSWTEDEKAYKEAHPTLSLPFRQKKVILALKKQIKKTDKQPVKQNN